MPAQAPAPLPVRLRLRREDFAPGDAVSFEGRDLIRKFGTIRRTNQKTASITCEDALEWRVSFGLLQRVISVEGAPLPLMVGPHAQDPDRTLCRKDLVHHAVLNIDAARIRAGKISDQLFERWWHLERIGCRNRKQILCLWF